MTQEGDPVSLLLSRRPPLPKEHGSWVMLAVALIAAAGVAGRLNAPFVLLALSALSWFVLRRPLIMLIRGEARDAAQLAAARRWLAAYALAGTAAGLPLLLVYRLWLLVPLALVGALLMGTDLLRARRSARPTFASEMAGALGTALVGGAGYYAAAGRLNATALALFAALALQFVSGVCYIRMKVRWVKQPPANLRVRWSTGWENVVYHIAALGAALGFSLLGLWPRGGWLVLLPTVAHRLAMTVYGRRETDFRRLGRLESVLASLFLLLLLLQFHPV